MARTSFPFPACASQQQIRDVSARIYSQVFESPRTIFLDAEARGQGSWQFFMVPLRPGDVEMMEGFGALSLTCRAQHAAVVEFLGDETIFELKIAPPGGPTLTCSPDPHNIIKNMARLDIWLTPESNTHSRSDWVIVLKVRRDGRVRSCEARKMMGVLEGGEWWTGELAWLNHVNLADEHARAWEVEGESSEEDESDVEMGEGEEQPSGDEKTLSGEDEDEEDEEMAEGGSGSSEGSEMSVDV
ncbi:hypothetical protein M409DRAFT_60411 [Zasmidium cellare ATCC 36951]|uniref:Uncharacterized protein n=1 Tax=Zasmidium cellare ATCC 36951 TaxID=1080233 RepID=A0A6A6BYZ6_ZASCE|nr:uncharacterized protein M409DRAFT_60411 [Zasmidium cellare ATCC 36951]KAF2160011.1 hypothetical protein M409DRAFT_60411 [Zasmidium cellare ATCC 36951]